MSSPVDLVVGRRMRRRRRLMGMTQGELGAACGVSFQQVQKYESGQTRVSVAMLWRLACVLDVEVGYFFADLPRDLPAELARRRRARSPAPAAEPVARPRANAA